MIGRILAVDPGEKNIGIAISDPTATIARSLKVIKHSSMLKDCQEIISLCTQNEVVQIIIGSSDEGEGTSTPQGRHLQKMVDTLQSINPIPVELWDERSSTRAAVETRRLMGVNRKQRSGHLDDLAAVIILQSYLDHQSE